MCGLTGAFGPGADPTVVAAMTAELAHRGPDGHGLYRDPAGNAVLGHRRLAVLDLSTAGLQPMSGAGGRFRLVFNGEIYNYLELRRELAAEHAFTSGTDTEVLLAAWERWGVGCLPRLVGMFAFLLWDTTERRLWAVRDRFGVKPLYRATRADGTLLLASEIKALRRVGAGQAPDATAWATYLTHGNLDHSDRTFWDGITAVPAGHVLHWRPGEPARVERWYDLAARVAEEDRRPLADVRDEYLSLLEESVRLRFRADVPVGINLSGGLDSSLLLGLVHRAFGADSDVTAFTFATGDPAYDELPWVERMLAATRHPLVVARLAAADVPALAAAVQAAEDEPFGGLPTLAYARLFETARDRGIVVLLDGQGMDEQWGGYDYYAAAAGARPVPTVQGTAESPVRPSCLTPELRHLAAAASRDSPPPSDEPLRRLQMRDLLHTKLPRALRFNDRVSMRSSRELREPFLDHRLVELALRQPADRKIRDVEGRRVHKWLLREIAAEVVPPAVREAPKRPVQTPQREWLRGPLAAWVDDLVEQALGRVGGTWLDADAVRAEWRAYLRGQGDNSFFVWQWISLGMMPLAVESEATR